MPNIGVLNNFSMPNAGNYTTGWQGGATAKQTDPYDLTVTGDKHDVSHSLLTGTVATLYDNEDDFPTAPVFFWYKADQVTYLQLITGITSGAGTSVIIGPIPANTPIMLPVASVLGAATTTLMTGTAPAVVAVDSVVVGNYSGSTANVRLVAIK